MKRVLVILIAATLLFSCKGNGSKSGSFESGGRITYPELAELVQEKNNQWQLGDERVCTYFARPLEVIQAPRRFHELRLTFRIDEDQIPVFWVSENLQYHLSGERLLSDSVLQDGQAIITNEENDSKLIVKARKTTIGFEDALRAINYIIKNPHGVTISYETPIDPIIVYCENLEGFQEVYSYYMKMYHPNLPGARYKAPED